MCHVMLLPLAAIDLLKIPSDNLSVKKMVYKEESLLAYKL